jgi:hypothetical protein
MSRISPYISVLILIFFLSCALTNQSFPDQPGRTIAAYDFSSEITVPANWFGLQVHDTAVIEAGDLENQLYLIVLRDSRLKYYYHPNMTLQEYSLTSSWYLIDNLKDITLEDPRGLTIHGMKAIQREIHGTAGDKKVSYLHTSIEGRSNYFQIIAWTYRDKYKKAGALFQTITRSFHELSTQESPPDKSDPGKSF